MHRRNFLKLASTLGTIVPGWALTPAAFSQTETPYTGKVLINVFASGGCDQSSWTDPRENDKSINSYAGVTPAGKAGNIRYAPMGNNKDFFDTYHKQCLVINGVHSGSNDHRVSLLAQHTGTLSAGFPNITELFSSPWVSRTPMPWLNGTTTGYFPGDGLCLGLVPVTPIPSEDTLRFMAQPNSAPNDRHLMKQADIDKVHQARHERMQAFKAAGRMLPHREAVVDQFLSGGQSRSALAALASQLPTTFDSQKAAHIALVLAKSGYTTAVQIGLARFAFDTHENHDAKMAIELPKLTNLIDYIWQKSAALNMSHRVFVRIFSEFGRTPFNSNNGKDHWPVGSQIWMEAKPTWGNRVFGASGPKHEALKISPSTGAIDTNNGVVMRPAHLHAALRSYLGIQTVDPKYDLKVPASENFDFFNPQTSTGYPNL